MMMDQYKERYKKETEQIHAPAELIARTKAAMREEEARLKREFAARAMEPMIKGVPTASGSAKSSAGDRKYARRFHGWKWAYPLTAAAALLILGSVSVMMRGLKSGDRSMSGAPSFEMAMESESSAMSSGADLDGGMAAAGAAMASEGSVEMTEEAFADEMVSAEADLGAAPASVAETEDMSDSLADTGNAVSDMAASEEEARGILAEKAEPKETQRSESQGKFMDTEKSIAKNAAEASLENGAQSNGAAADAGSITIEKVVKKPDFCGYADTETRVYEGEIFQITEKDNGWAAYVETKDGDKYVIRGEAENMEMFLELGYRKLVEEE